MQNSNFLDFHSKNPKFRFNQKIHGLDKSIFGPYKLNLQTWTNNGSIWVYLSLKGSKIDNLYFELKNESDHSQSAFNEDMAILDVICLLSQGRSRPRLALLNFREIENYLRHSPLEPLWIGDDFNQKEVKFEELKHQLIYMIETHWLQISGKSSQVHSDTQKIERSTWFGWSMIQRMAWVEQFFNEQIRPVLNQDGGDLVIVDVDSDSVVFSYKGACLTCSSKLKGTLSFIEDRLKSQCLDSLALKLVAE